MVNVNMKLRCTNWMMVLEKDNEVRNIKKKFLSNIESAKLYHWHSFLLAAKSAVKNASNPRSRRLIFCDIMERLENWFENMDWDKWQSVLWEAAKIVIPILVMLIFEIRIGRKL